MWCFCSATTSIWLQQILSIWVIQIFQALAVQQRSPIFLVTMNQWTNQLCDTLGENMFNWRTQPEGKESYQVLSHWKIRSQPKGWSVSSVKKPWELSTVCRNNLNLMEVVSKKLDENGDIYKYTYGWWTKSCTSTWRDNLDRLVRPLYPLIQCWVSFVNEVVRDFGHSTSFFLTTKHCPNVKEGVRGLVLGCK